MSRLQFEFLHAHLTFKDIDTREERWEHDQFAAMREFLEQCNINFGKALVPEDYISLDETLYPTKNLVSYKQYHPNKLSKYGMLFKSLSSARYLYTHALHTRLYRKTNR